MSQMFEDSEEPEEEDFIFYKPEKRGKDNKAPDQPGVLESGKDEGGDHINRSSVSEAESEPSTPPGEVSEPSILPEEITRGIGPDSLEQIELNIDDNIDDVAGGKIDSSYNEAIAEKMDPSNLRRVIRDTPISELTLRKYEMPYEENRRELLKKLCLSLGLLQPGDSRDIVVDVLHVLMQARKEKKPLDSEEIRALVIEERKKLGLPMLGIASSNVRRQIKRLRDLFIVEKMKNEYIITEYASLELIFKDKIESYLMASIVLRLKEYLKAIDKKFS